MGPVEEIAGGVRTALAKIEEATAALKRAGQELEEAGGKWSEAASGTSDPTVAGLPGMVAEVGASSETVSGLIGRSSDLLDGYLHSLGVPAESTSVGASGQSAPPSPATSSSDPEEDEDLVEQARRELPPPVTRRRGVKTQGRWFAPGKTIEPISSGRDKYTEQINQVLADARCPYVPVTVAADVELKIAAEMREKGITEATVVINNTPCEGPASCDALLGVVLSEGSTLTVHGTGGFTKTYKGGAQPW
ncbi:hypothetical protein BS329_41630 [Amycolatopsis coloradensis]|uniref:SCP1.201-like deaminase n=1 Tax=Amycolatopsis coloradensis TaxID=76021 RepID=A0A1R0KD13_9PSEU|nr:DddA-like double-stranded DNA deaminase toxin [Amycolatopsis coloradensis]OLZ42779.1 hypothetical protein BS329_41630 [Amycolatopsis coloradensis]